MNHGEFVLRRSLTEHWSDDGAARRGVQGLHLRPDGGQSLGVRQQEAQQPERSRTHVALENRRLALAQQSYISSWPAAMLWSGQRLHWRPRLERCPASD